MNRSNPFSEIKEKDEEKLTANEQNEIFLEKRIQFLNNEASRFQKFVLTVLNEYANELLIDGNIEYIPPTIKDSSVIAPQWVAYDKTPPQKPIFIGLSFKDEKGDWPTTGFWISTSKSYGKEYTKLSKQDLIGAIKKIYISNYSNK